MKNFYVAASALSAAVLLSACDNNLAEHAKAPIADTKAQIAPQDIAAKVNDVVITRDAVAAMKADIAQRRHGNANDIPDEKITEELVSRELLKQEAEKNGLLKDPKLAAVVENAARITLSQVDAENFVKNVVISDDEAKQEYEQRIKTNQTKEYKARHILVENEAEAKSIIEKLGKGAKFDELAKKFSKDPGSKANGGDLGWFSPQQMVPAFSEAVVALADGASTQQPVQSQFGWHVIQREASRDQEPTPFDQVKDQLKSMMQAQKLQQHLAELRKAAVVEIESAPKPASDAAAAAPAETTPGQPAAAQEAPATAK
jgi:peptidyl-prolyl cis-trans isomerase C